MGTENILDELVTLQVGDLVDFDMECNGIYTVRVEEIVDDVSELTPQGSEPGIVGRICYADHDPAYEGCEVVVGQSSILIKSKAKYFFGLEN